MFRGVCEYCTALWVEDSSEEYVRAQLNRHIELNHADKLPAVPAVPLFKLKCPNCPDSVGGQTFEETHVALGVHIRFAHSEKES
jgi:hypothetical protein